jgi:hypothetical protein
MDLELALWIAVFVGGYSAVLGYLLRIALKKKDDAPPPSTG